MITQQFDSSLIATEAEHDAHYARQCGKCERDLSREDIELDREYQDGWCDECRSLEDAAICSPL
jgi:hypothetical protein